MIHPKDYSLPFASISNSSRLLCYLRGIITSRPIEYACKTNIIVKALARDVEPDHAPIAHCISSQGEAVKGLFAQVLLKCYVLGLIGGELFVIDDASCYRCPAQKQLSYKEHIRLNRNSGEKYHAKSSDCKDCTLR